MTDNTGFYAGGGSAAAFVVAAAGVFYMRRGKTATAEMTETTSNNTNMNPLYEGSSNFENPLYHGEFNDGLDDGFGRVGGNNGST
jgi:hypothetical protein